MSASTNWEDAYRAQTARVEELRRENAALREDNLKAHQMACAAGLERDRLRDELAALREDKEILDWMNGNIEAIMFKYKPDGFIWDVREIMRGAMSKETKP